RLGNVTVTLSLNSASELGRAVLMGDRHAGKAIRSADLLKEYGVPFHGSVVAMPHLVGWEDLEMTVKYLCASGAETVRVFLPGFTGMAAPALRFEEPLWDELSQFVSRLREETATPLTCEPPAIRDLTPEVVGVIEDSPAARAGFCKGDVIEVVNGHPVHTRVHAFQKLLKAGPSEVNVKREDRTVSLRIHKRPGERSGLVMDYDLDPALIRDMAREARRRAALKTLVLTSELAGPVINLGIRRFWGGPGEADAVVVKNRFFGGSIKAAGLLTVQDMEAAAEEFLQGATGIKPRLALLPGLAFDRRGRDLTGRSYLELEERFGIPFEAF
ncbi:MAG: PDZ domain-containing protein, partial [Firmicutes bacterium]|nr:PDZ domain-containing protein [Bacillota bacterium]